MFFTSYSKFETEETGLEPDVSVPMNAKLVNEVKSNAVSGVGEVVSPQEPEVSLSDPELGGAEPERGGFVKKVISEKWLDAEGKAGRRRVRIVEADFKYPRIRLEETVWTDPETGEQRVARNLASVADHVLVGLKKGSDRQLTQQVLEKEGYLVHDVRHAQVMLVGLPQYDDTEDQNTALVALEGFVDFVEYAEPDYLLYSSLIPNDPAIANNKMWALENAGNLAGTKQDADIDAPQAWGIRHDANDIIVAVIDSGVQYNHEELLSNMWRHPESGVFGYDAYDNDEDPMDNIGHGTHCAGIIGAQGNNGVGFAGVAWNVRLMAGRFLGPNGGVVSDAIQVIQYARMNGAHVINASWGGGGYSKSLYNEILACGETGIPVVAAAGNDGFDSDSTPHYPSSYDLPLLVSVASTTSQDRLSSFSNYGRYSVDIAAPGSDIWSCTIGSNSQYRYESGTSMAAPYVTGALALAKAHFQGENTEELLTRLYSSVDSIDSLANKVASGGRLNLNRLLGSSSSDVVNDDFENALVFQDDYAHWQGWNNKATREIDEDEFSLPDTGIRSVWFAWRAPYSGLVEFTVNSDTSKLRAIAFRGREKNHLTLVSEGGRLGKAGTQIIRFYCEVGQEYRFLVDSNDAEGESIAVSLGLKPENDFILQAQSLQGDRFLTLGSNRSATAESFELLSPHAGLGKGKSVWWKWVPDFDGDFVVTTQGSAFDTVLAVYSGSVGALTEVVANDDRNALDWTSMVTFSTISGATYYIAVDGYRGDGAGAIVLNGFKSGQLTIVKQPEDIEVVPMDRAVFEVAVSAGGSPRYQWFFNGSSLPGETHASLVIDPVEKVHYGNYHVVVSNDEQSENSQVVTLSEKKQADRKSVV